MTRTPFRRTMSHRDLVGLFRSSHWSCCVEKCGLKNFANFLGKHLCWSLFVIALPVELHLRKTASICFTSKYYNKWQWRIWTRLDLYRVQSIFLNVQRCRSEVFCKKAVARRCSVKKLFIEISQNSQESTCARASFSIKSQALGGGVIEHLWGLLQNVTVLFNQMQPR